MKNSTDCRKEILDKQRVPLLLFSLASINSASPGPLIEQHAFADHQTRQKSFDCFL